MIVSLAKTVPVQSPFNEYLFHVYGFFPNLDLERHWGLNSLTLSSKTPCFSVNPSLFTQAHILHSKSISSQGTVTEMRFDKNCQFQ